MLPIFAYHRLPRFFDYQTSKRGKLAKILVNKIEHHKTAPIIRGGICGDYRALLAVGQRRVWF
jgi:hypothetical protein